MTHKKINNKDYYSFKMFGVEFTIIIKRKSE